MKNNMKTHIVRYHTIDRNGDLRGRHEAIVDAPDVASAQKLFKKRVLVPKGERLRLDSIEEQ